jgi:hypothetical protein
MAHAAKKISPQKAARFPGAIADAKRLRNLTPSTKRPMSRS